MEEQCRLAEWKSVRKGEWGSKCLIRMRERRAAWAVGEFIGSVCNECHVSFVRTSN